MSRYQRLGLFLEHIWRPLLDWVLVISLVGGLLIYRLATLLPYPSQAEIASKAAASNLRVIGANPLFLPYKLLQYVLITSGHDSLLYMRLVSVLYAAMAIGLIFFVLRRWHTSRIALIGMFMFASSSWFLTYARTGVPTIMYTLLIATLAYGAWARKTKKATTALLVGAALAAGLIYIPGLIWFVVGAAFWQRNQLGAYASKTAKSVPFALLLFIILLLPLAVSLIKHPTLIREVLGFPARVNLQLGAEFIKNIARTADQLVLHGPANASGGIVGIALLDIFVIMMVLLGFYAYIFRRKLDRAKMIVGVLGIGTVLVCLGGPVNLILLLPLLYIVAAGGIAFMLQQWLTVFPRNPLARTIGISLMVAVVAASSFYHIKRYFVVWPHTAETKQVFKASNHL